MKRRAKAVRGRLNDRLDECHPIYPFIRFEGVFSVRENAISLRINKLERVITATWMKGRYVSSPAFSPELRLVRSKDCFFNEISRLFLIIAK